MQGRSLTRLDRDRIEWYWNGGLGVRAVGKLIRRNHSVVSREIAANRKPDGKYSAVYAQEQSDGRRARKGSVRRKLDRDAGLREFVTRQLREGFAPGVVAGRMRVDRPNELSGRTVSHEAIYQWLYAGEGHALGLWKCLLSERRKRRGHGTRRPRRTPSIPDRISIDLRGEEASTRETLGHWESDSVIFPKAHKQRLSVQIERKARLVRIHRLSSGSAQDTLDALRDSIASVPQDCWKSITFDNGSEGALHATLRREYDVETLFCDPYASWQKGSVENANRIIRRYLPRSLDLSTVTDKQIYDIQERINDTPRKILGYRTPNEAFAEDDGKVVR